MDDGKDLNDLLEALKLFMPDSKLRLVMRLLTAVLHIGTLPIIGERVQKNESYLTWPLNGLSCPFPSSMNFDLFDFF